MKVVSVDPAPRKMATICDGERITRVKAVELPEYCTELSSHGDVLLVWDAPLTGPPSPPLAGDYARSYSQRVLEAFFRQKSSGFKTPAGISVLPYCGCPHWTITRASLGLPILGRFDRPVHDLPFRPIYRREELQVDGCFVVESHPAVAIWLWQWEAAALVDGSWIYKGAKAEQSIPAVWESLTRVWRESNSAVIDILKQLPPPIDDDELDAVVGWIMGALFVADSPLVEIVGNEDTGAMILPTVPGLRESFEQFRESALPASHEALHEA